MKTSILTFVAFLISLQTQCQPKVGFTPSFVESTETTHKISDDQAYTFGYLEVLENRSESTGTTVKIPVYIFKSRSQQPKQDPIIYTVGGPGYTTMSSAPYMEYYQYLDDRDFILVEQRGNQYAQPHLDCPEWSKAIYQSNLPDFDNRQSEVHFAAAARSCRDRLTQQGIDLNTYNTNEIAADINDLVDALDIAEYNLLTISYSTKIAQVLLRDYPDKIRSIVMDSPLPLEVNYDQESNGHLMQALDRLLTDCENDESCRAAYPNLKQRFSEYLISKTMDPLAVEVINPTNEELVIFYLKGKDLITVFTSAGTSSVANVPYEINKLLNDDLSTIKKQLRGLFSGPRNGAGMGMRLSVWCAEEHPFNQPNLIKKETNIYPEIEGLSPTTIDPAICAIWGVEPVSPIENQAVKSEIPVLLINGEYDEATPVIWAQGMTQNLTNSFHLIFAGWKHTPTTNWSNPCAMQAANDFFNNPKVKPNPDCFVAIKSPQFKRE